MKKESEFKKALFDWFEYHDEFRGIDGVTVDGYPYINTERGEDRWEIEMHDEEARYIFYMKDNGEIDYDILMFSHKTPIPYIVKRKIMVLNECGYSNAPIELKDGSFDVVDMDEYDDVKDKWEIVDEYRSMTGDFFIVGPR